MKISSLVIAFIAIFVLIGCVKPLPISLEGPGIERVKSNREWSKDIGPEKSGNYRSLVVDNFDDDCELDIIGGTTEPGDIFYWLGDGVGNWQRQQRIQIRADVRSMASGDVNNDCYQDLVFSSIGDTKGIHVLINEHGRFRAGRPVTERELYEGLRLVDINKDGNLDIIAANTSNASIGGIQVWFGDGKGNFIPETGPTRLGIYKDVAVADIDKDGNLDIVGAGWGVETGSLRVWLGLGDGRWSDSPVLTKGSFWGVEIADVDGDGNLDIIAASNFNGVHIYYGDGHGAFPRSEMLTEKGSFWRAKAYDINGDDLMDIIATSNDNHGIIIWYQQKDPKRKWIVKDEGMPKDGYYFDVDCKDLNGDLKLDIIATSHGEGMKVWFRGKAEHGKFKKTCKKPPVIEERVVEREKIVEKEKVVEKIVIPMFYTAVFFDTGKVDLRPETIVVLNKLVEFLKKTEGTIVRLEGFADPRDIRTQEFPNNQILSEGRVKSVTKYLLDNGMQKNRIEGSGLGDSLIKYPGSDPGSMQKNRRVDITIVYKGNPAEAEILKKEPNKNSDVSEEAKKEKKSEIKAINVKKEEKGKVAAEPPTEPFGESKLLIPAKEYMVFKEINNVPEYRIGSGDVIGVTIWEGIKENNYKVQVSPQGDVSFSYITNFKITSLTPTEAEMEFVKLLKQFVKAPRVKMEVPEKRAYNASIFGAVRDLTRQPTGPGTYILYGKERLTQFISRVGGYLTNADLTHVELTRDRKTYVLNVYDALFKADFRQDVLIDDGDVLFIPYKTEVKNRVFVFGEVMRPGLFVYDANISLLEVVTRAGGPTFYAKTDEVVIIRGDETKPEAFKSNLRDIYERGDLRNNVSLQNGDIIYMAKNAIGDIRDFMRTVSPFLSIMRLPMDLYGATAIPEWEGFPLQRPAAPTPSTILSTPPSLPPDKGPWDAK